jgi:hypothetical protein
MTIARKVVVLIASHDTQAGLKAWAEEQGFDLATDYDGNPRPADRFDFHVTLVASKNEVFVPDTQHMIKPVGLDALGFAELGVDRRVPVLKMTPSARLIAMRAFFVETYGLEPTFADYKPHVSLSYAWDGSSPDLGEVEMPDVPLVFDQLRVKSLSPPAKSLDWTQIGRQMADLRRLIV